MSSGYRAVLRAAILVTLVGLSVAWQDWSSCGTRPAVGKSGRIVGGGPSDEGDWPWMAKTWRNDPYSEDGRARCGASLIHKEWILTAAHCISVMNEPSLHFHVFGTNTTVVGDFSANVQVRGVSEIYVHPNYSDWRDQTLDWDVAVMKLSEEVVLTDYVQPVCLPTADMVEDSFPEGTQATITGWGTTEQGGAQNPDLFEVTVPIVSQDACQKYYAEEVISERMICAGLDEGGKDSCQGDSGGPMVAIPSGNSRWFQPGVVSWGYGCAQPEYPGVYARVSAFQDWLEPIWSGNGPTEKYGDNGCAPDEFMCKGLLCISHASRCDSRPDCYYDHDEKECGTYARFFDPMPMYWLNSFNLNVYVANDEECARHCVEQPTFDCYSFGTEAAGEQRRCYLADATASANATASDTLSADDTRMYYRLLRPDSYVAKEVSFTQRHNFMVTPRWMSGQGTGGNGSGWYIWTIQPANPEDRYNSILFTFTAVRALAGTTGAEDECTSSETMNTVLIRSGVGVSDPVAAAFCLHDLPETFRLMSPEARLEFYTVDPAQYGFLGEYSADWFTDSTQTAPTGTITSPNYPAAYPPNTLSTTLLQAPEGVLIHLNLTSVRLETDPDGRCFDTLTVYDGADSATSEQLFQICSSKPESYFWEVQSSSNALLVVFSSDYTVQAAGFEAKYSFLSGPTREEVLDSSLTNFKYGMTAMGIFFFCLTMVFVVSIVTINARERKERAALQKLQHSHRQSSAVAIIPEIVDDTAVSDKPSTSGASSSQGADSSVIEVEGKTNPAYSE